MRVANDFSYAQPLKLAFLPVFVFFPGKLALAKHLQFAFCKFAGQVGVVAAFKVLEDVLDSENKGPQQSKREFACGK